MHILYLRIGESKLMAENSFLYRRIRATARLLNERNEYDELGKLLSEHRIVGEGASITELIQKVGQMEGAHSFDELLTQKREVEGRVTSQSDTPWWDRVSTR